MTCTKCGERSAVEGNVIPGLCIPCFFVVERDVFVRATTGPEYLWLMIEAGATQETMAEILGIARELS